MRTPPDYYEQVRQNAAQLWEKLEQYPDLAGPWHKLFKQVQSPRHVLSELLQNADDARATEATVRIENQTFVFEHNGDDFTEEQLASLCRFGYSNKRALHTIGFRGVGFKSTFSLGDPVKLITPTLSICFFQKRFTEPQWVDGETDTLGKTRVMVQTADLNRQGQVEKNLKEWLENPFSLLFFKNLRRICIADTELQWGSLGPGPVANSEWMALNEDTTHDYLLIRSDAESFPDDAIEEIRRERKLEGDEEEEFPSCEIDILVGRKGKLYVILPTGVDTELPFACNAPFIQDPARLKISDPETSPTNRWLLERAGKLAASAMLSWLRNTGLSAAERAQAYSLFPDVDRADESLNGVCGKSVKCSFETQVGSERLLLTEAGSLVAQKRSVAVPQELFDIWPGEQIDKFLGYRKRPALSQYIAPDDRRKLVNWGLIEEIGKQDFIRILETKSAPRPRSWQELLKLWAYVAPEVAGIELYSSRFSAADLRIAPVQGKEVLFAPKKVVRLGKRKLLNSDSDWEFLHRHLIVLNPNWPRFLAKQRRNAADHNQPLLRDEVDMAYEVLVKAGLDKTSDVSKVVREVGRQFFSHERVDLQDCVRLSQIAAKLGAKVSGAFKFMTAKSNLRSASYGLLFDADGGLWGLLPKKLRDSSVLHPAYVEEFTSCSNEEWNRWISSGDAGLQTFVCPAQSSKSYRSRRGLERALRSRGYNASVNHKYRAPKFCIRDWDFPAALWNHWQQMSLEDDDVWRKIAVRILSEKDAFWRNKESPEVIETASGWENEIACEGLVSSWVRKLGELPCLPDTHGIKRKPHELLRRTPETESQLDVEPFIERSLDQPQHSSLLDLFGVRNKPDGPDRLIGRLQSLAGVESPPVAEVEKWYSRLDTLMATCSTDDDGKIRNAFHTGKLILTQNGIWEGPDGVFLSTDENDVPGADVIRASVRGLTLWRKIGVADRPTPELAIKWLAGLPTGEPLDSDTLRRVRSLLRRHPQRIWSERQHWLSLAGEWVSTDALEWSLTNHSPVPWSHLHEWVKKQTADLRKLPMEVTGDSPFCQLPLLASRIEERLQEGVFPPSKPAKKGWLTTFAAEMARADFNTEEETRRIRQLARRLARLRWIAASEIKTTPYIEGKPAGTARSADVLWLEDRLLYINGVTGGKLARRVPEEVAKAFDGRADIMAALAYCFERSSRQVREYLHENFNLASVSQSPQVTTEKTGEQSTGENDVSGVGEGKRADQSSGDFQHNASPDTLTGGENAQESVAEEESTEAPEPPTDAEEARTKRRSSRKRAGPSIIERYAIKRGFRKAAEDRYSHEDGRSIAKTRGEMFAWEQRAANGEILRYYWPKEHCLEQEPLEIDASVWDRVDQAPETHALVLAAVDGQPTAVTGQQLRALRHQGRITLFPATYRVVYDSRGRR